LKEVSGTELQEFRHDWSSALTDENDDKKNLSLEIYKSQFLDRTILLNLKSCDSVGWGNITATSGTKTRRK